MIFVLVDASYRGGAIACGQYAYKPASEPSQTQTDITIGEFHVSMNV